MPEKIQVGPFVPFPQEGAKTSMDIQLKAFLKSRDPGCPAKMTSGTNVICKNSEVSHAIL